MIGGGICGVIDAVINYFFFDLPPVSGLTLGAVAGYVKATKTVGTPMERISFWRNVFKKPKTLQKKSVLKIVKKPLSKMKILKTIP